MKTNLVFHKLEVFKQALADFLSQKPHACFSISQFFIYDSFFSSCSTRKMFEYRVLNVSAVCYLVSCLLVVAVAKFKKQIGLANIQVHNVQNCEKNLNFGSFYK